MPFRPSYASYPNPQPNQLWGPYYHHVDHTQNPQPSNNPLTNVTNTLPIPQPLPNNTSTPHAQPIPLHPKRPSHTVHCKKLEQHALAEANLPAVIQCTLKAANTNRHKEREVGLFCNWCSTSGKNALPASKTTLCKYTLHYARKIAGSTVRQKLSALKTWHVQQQLPWNRNLLLRNTLKGIDNLTPASSFRPKCELVTLNMLHILHYDLIDNTNTTRITKGSKGFRRCVYTASTALFAGQLWQKEVLVGTEDPAKYQPLLLPTVGNLSKVIESNSPIQTELPSRSHLR
ncbi:hypothetical protein D9758_002619 [Tetrapyrgos nigripes]|uniref:Uncharacterized protein n=1 Tax=Tetrapyrgos nigripes TaxID=182062 RepID=A0A8H5LTS3_9AGAR|nr:hypothetical protein D9758_002619 [Tetrapyrgos nigripes]